MADKVIPLRRRDGQRTGAHGPSGEASGAGAGEGDGLSADRRGVGGVRPGASALMAVVLVAWAMLFVSLLFTLLFVRVQAEAWPPPGARALQTGPEALVLGTLSLGAILLTVARGGLSLETKRRLATALWIVGAVLVLVAVGMELKVFLAARAVGGKDAFGSTHRTFLLLHAVHLALSLPALLTISVRAARGHYADARAGGSGPRLWSLYCRFAVAAYGAMFGLVHAG